MIRHSDWNLCHSDHTEKLKMLTPGMFDLEKPGSQVAKSTRCTPQEAHIPNAVAALMIHWDWVFLQRR